MIAPRGLTFLLFLTFFAAGVAAGPRPVVHAAWSSDLPQAQPVWTSTRGVRNPRLAMVQTGRIRASWRRPAAAPDPVRPVAYGTSRGRALQSGGAGSPGRFHSPGALRAALAEMTALAFLVSPLGPVAAAPEADAQGHGALATMAYRVNDSLIVGSAIAAVTRRDDSGIDLLPLFLLDWTIADRWSVSSLPVPGGLRGPGLALRYDPSDVLSLSVSARYQAARAQPGRSGLAARPGARQSRVPVVLGLTYLPSSRVAVTGFAGAAFDGALRTDVAVAPSGGSSAAPVAGLSLTFRF